MKIKIYEVSFFCNYPTGDPQTHRQSIKLTDISKWIESYKFTHPNCTSISTKVWFHENTK